MALTLVSSATASGAIAGLLAAIVMAPVAWLGRRTLGPDTHLFASIDGYSVSMWHLVLALVSVAVALDVVGLILGRPRPPAVGRQVPQEWGRLLSPTTVAALYGARLGVGPLTILSTWTWWAVTIASALAGPLQAATVGATFGFVRLTATVAVSLTALDPTRSWRYQRLGTLRRPGWATLSGLAVALAATMTFSGCTSIEVGEAGSRPRLQSEPFASQPHESQPHESQASQFESSEFGGTRPLDGGSPIGNAGTANPDPVNDNAESQSGPSPDDEVTATVVTTPATLEEFVRAPLANTDAEAVSGLAMASTPMALTADPAELSSVLVGDIIGFERIDTDEANRFLDLPAAARLQPDSGEEVALLETRGFQGGWTRAFRNTANDVVVTSVYHFDDQAEAEFYLEDGLITIGGYGGKFFDVDEVSGVRGFAQTFEDGGESLVSLGAVFQAGPRWFLVYIVGSEATVGPHLLFPTVVAQRERALAAMSTSPAVAVP